AAREYGSWAGGKLENTRHAGSADSYGDRCVHRAEAILGGERVGCGLVWRNDGGAVLGHIADSADRNLIGVLGLPAQSSRSPRLDISRRRLETDDPRIRAYHGNRGCLRHFSAGV